MLRFKVPNILSTLLPGFLWRVNTLKKELYLSFDDGPHPRITPYVLETLQVYNAKACFFCVGENVEKYPEVYRDILDGGHTTGNHTYHHLNGWRTTLTGYEQDTDKAAGLIKSRLFRPPYGRITPAQARSLRKQYTLVMWDILSCDYDEHLNTKRSLNAIKRLSRPGSILVFHDTEKAEANLKKILPETLRYFTDKGYSFKALTA